MKKIIDIDHASFFEIFESVKCRHCDTYFTFDDEDIEGVEINQRGVTENTIGLTCPSCGYLNVF